MAVAAPATAAPLNPLPVCETFEDSGTVFEICTTTTGRGVTENRSASGVVVQTVSEQSTRVITADGQFVQQIDTKQNVQSVFKDNVLQVFHGSIRQLSFAWFGQTCTLNANFTIADGVERHFLNDFECTP